MCSKDRLDIHLSICAWMSSIRFAVNFLFDFYEKVSFKKLSKFQSDEKAKEYDHHIRHKKLSIKSLKNQLSTFLGEKIHCSKLFCVFLKTSFSCKAPNCATYNLPRFNFVRSSWNFYHRYFEVSSRGRIGRFDFWRSHPDLEGSESQKTGFPENL